MIQKKIAVLGCGWLGMALAKYLKTHGYEVLCSTTTSGKKAEFNAAGLRHFILDLGNPASSWPDDFLNAGWLVISTPPAALSRSLDKLTSWIAKNPELKIILISSTAVYPNLNREVREEDAAHRTSAHSGIDLLSVEKAITKAACTTVLRLGGLYGPERHPGRFLAGKTGLKNGRSPVNLIHQEDVVNIIEKVIRENAVPAIFNAVAPVHPTREEFYTKAAGSIDMPPPEFLQDDQPAYKLVLAASLEKALNYQFVHKDPMQDL